MRRPILLWAELVLVVLSIIALAGCGDDTNLRPPVPTPTPTPTPTPPPLNLEVQILPSSGQTIFIGNQQIFRAIVINDTSNQGVTWDADCSEEACGTLDVEDDGNLYYTAPMMQDPLQVTIRATSNADPRATDVVSVTVLPLEDPVITTTQQEIPDGMVQHQFSLQLSVAGGVAPYTFSLASESSLPPGLQLDEGQIVGYPTTAVANHAFGITVTDDNGETATKQFTLNVRPIPNGEGNSLLNGNYAFIHNGSMPEFGDPLPTSLIGYLQADGQGHITAGLLEFNVAGRSGIAYVDMSNGTYAIGPDNRGIITLPAPSGQIIQEEILKAAREAASKQPRFDRKGRKARRSAPLTNVSGPPPAVTIAVSLGFVEDGVAQRGALTALPNTPFAPVAGPGTLLRREESAFNLDSFSGNFAFLMTGGSASGFPAVSGGVLSAAADEEGSDTGTISTAIMDTAGASGATSAIEMEGAYGLDPNIPGRGTLTMGGEGVPSDHPTGYVFYIVDAGRAFIMSTGAGNTTRMVAGELRKQQLAQFDDTALDGNFVMTEVVSGLLGDNGFETGNVLLQGNCDDGECTLDYMDQQTDTGFATRSGGSTITFAVAENGRAVLQEAPPYLYLINQNEGFVLHMSSAKIFGHGLVQRQGSVGSEPEAFAGEYLVGSLPVLDWWPGGISGVVAADSDGALSGATDYADMWYAALSKPFTGEWSLFGAPGRIQVTQDGKISLICYAAANVRMMCMVPGEPSNGILTVERPYNY